MKKERNRTIYVPTEKTICVRYINTFFFFFWRYEGKDKLLMGETWWKYTAMSTYFFLVILANHSRQRVLVACIYIFFFFANKNWNFQVLYICIYIHIRVCIYIHTHSTSILCFPLLCKIYTLLLPFFNYVLNCYVCELIK